MGRFLEIHQLARESEREDEALDLARRATAASERAARWAMWSALISVTVGVVSAAAYWLSRVPG